jgi:hypothetical protein
MQPSDQSEQFISRKGLALRWRCSCETVKRRQREGLLRGVYFNQRMLRYPMSEVLAVESEGRNGRLIKGELSAAEAERRKRLAEKRLGPRSFVPPPIGFQAKANGK